jgi:hypothetical protein
MTFPGDPVTGPLITMPGLDRLWRGAHLQLSRARLTSTSRAEPSRLSGRPIIRTHANEPDRGAGNEAAQQARRSGTAVRYGLGHLGVCQITSADQVDLAFCSLALHYVTVSPPGLLDASELA